MVKCVTNTLIMNLGDARHEELQEEYIIIYIILWAKFIPVGSKNLIFTNALSHVSDKYTGIILFSTEDDRSLLMVSIRKTSRSFPFHLKLRSGDVTDKLTSDL